MGNKQYAHTVHKTSFQFTRPRTLVLWTLCPDPNVWLACRKHGQINFMSRGPLRTCGSGKLVLERKLFSFLLTALDRNAEMSVLLHKNNDNVICQLKTQKVTIFKKMVFDDR